MLYQPADVYMRFQMSFGAWSELAHMMKPVEFLQLQRLCRYKYDVSISRAQSRFEVPENKIYMLNSFLLPSMACFVKEVGLGYSKSRSWRKLDAFGLELHTKRQNIMIGNTLYDFTKIQRFFCVYKYEGFLNSTIVKTDLKPLQLRLGYHCMLVNWAMTVIFDRFIIITGGIESSQGP